MNPNNYFIFPALLFYLDSNKHFFPFFVGNFAANLNQLNFLNNYFPRNLLPPNLIQTPIPIPNENIQLNSNNEGIKTDAKISCDCSKAKDKKKYFNVVYPHNDSLFNKTDKEDINLITEKDEINFLGNKRLSYRRQRKDNKDNIRTKIKRGFFNSALINKLNDKLKSIGSTKYFMKFPQNFVSDISQKRNKEIVNMTLKEIFEKKELYKQENEIGFDNYLHNLKVIQSEIIKENSEFKKILNKTFRELYEEYINSDEFKIGEIGRLKEHKMEDDYIKKYIYLSRELIDFFNQ
jgi:hypothetical protein